MSTDGLVQPGPPVIDPVKLEHRLTIMEETAKASEERITAILAAQSEEMRRGFQRVTDRQDIANGRVLTLEGKESARAHKESNQASMELGARQLRLGVKGWVVAGLAIVGGIVSVTAGLLTLLEKI